MGPSCNGTPWALAAEAEASAAAKAAAAKSRTKRTMISSFRSTQSA